MQLNDCSLQHDRIDIWEFPLHTLNKQHEPLLNDKERERATRFHFDRHQRRFTIARSTLRLILARYTQQNPQDIEFTYNKYGKPRVANVEIEFNLSHSGEWAILAIGTLPLGVDLEFFSARPYHGIANSLFSEQEQSALSRLPKKIMPLAFFNIWVQKEAFIKACGMGLAYPTQQFTVSELPNKNQTIFDPIHNKSWKMLSFMPQTNCSAALCYDPSISVLRKITIHQHTGLTDETI